jgi:methionyl-tRNA synthetase
MVQRYREGAVPADPGDDSELAAEVERTVAVVTADFDALDLTRALEDAWALVRRLNQLVEERAPWTLAKDPGRARSLDQVLASLAEGLRAVAILVWPFIPGSAERILERLGQPPDRVGLERAAWGAGIPGARVSAGAPLFPRVEEAAA